MEAFRIIQSYRVTEHAIFIQSKGFLTACRNTAAYYIIFLTVWNSWLRQQLLTQAANFEDTKYL